MPWLSAARDYLLDYLFPSAAAPLSLEGLALLPPAQDALGRETIALFEYAHQGVKDLVWEVKYRGSRQAAALAGTALYDAIIEELGERRVERALLIPMPASDRRRRERGWNQAELLCEAVKKRDLGERLEYRRDILCKTRHTESQTKAAGRADRLENLAGSMRAVEGAQAALGGAFAILLDDVTTTGATFSEAQRALRERGVRRVLCLALAH